MDAPVADLREGGQWTLAQRVKNDVLWLAAEATLAVTTRLPPGALRACGRALGAIAHALVPSARAIAEANVGVAFPELDTRARRALVRRTYRALGEHLGDTVAMLDARRPLLPLPFASGSRDLLGGALDEGRGVVFASAHLGPWERVAATLVDAGIPLTAIAREAYDPRLTRIYERLRGGRGVRVVWRSSPHAGSALLRTLRRGGLLGVPMDLASRVPSIEAPFLGRPAPTPVGPARLALRTGAAVVVGTVAPRPPEPALAMHDEPLVLLATRIPTDDLAPGPDGERALTARINAEISTRIRALPEAWVWMHRRWPPTM
jgi:KDO2-lipid IV(A) lauroyltransferase